MGAEDKAVLIGVIPPAGKRRKPIRVTAVYAKKDDPEAILFQKRAAFEMAKWGFFGSDTQEGG